MDRRVFLAIIAAVPLATLISPPSVSHVLVLPPYSPTANAFGGVCSFSQAIDFMEAQTVARIRAFIGES